jgi:multidrug efflux pump subunit AcrB
VPRTPTETLLIVTAVIFLFLGSFRSVFISDCRHPDLARRRRGVPL